MADTDVLIVGAGPTGLVLALWLARIGVRLRIVDRSEGPGTASRALAVQARTLEFYRQLGLAEAAIAGGRAAPAFNLWAGGRHRARVAFAEGMEDITPYPFVLVYGQDANERLLEGALARAGVTVERSTEMTGFAQDAAGVTARLRPPDGGEETCRAAWLAGCDGARSSVREGLGIGFPGGTYDRFFYVADIEAEGPAMNGEVHVNLDGASEFLAVFPMAGTGRARLVGTFLEDHPDRPETLGFEDVSAQAMERLGIAPRAVNWFSTYRVHHRVADRFRQGRAFLLGDAGHIHSPAGGQGMNTGMGDAVNLAWKLGMVLEGRAGEALLDSYEQERIGFARRLVATTDRAFTLATSDTPRARFLRTRVVPLLASVFRIRAARRLAFRTVSQTALGYRGGLLARGRAGRLQGGDRLPWVAEAAEAFVAPSPGAWRLRVHGSAAPGLEAWARGAGVAVQALPWSEAAAAAGFARDAAYLVRPDGYIALASSDGSPHELRGYFSAAPFGP